MNRDFFKVLVFDTLVKAAIKRLFVVVPLLGFGPIGVLVGFLIQKFADMAYEESKEMIIMNMIKFKNEANQKEFDSAFIKLKHIEKTASKEELNAAIKEAQKRMARFVRFDH